MTIKQLTEIVDGLLTPSEQKLDADLLEISQTEGNALELLEDGLMVNTSQFPTRDEVTEAIEQAQLGAGPIDSSDWTLTNASISNGILTYTGGTFEEEGVSEQTQIGLFAQRKLKIGESVTVDFKFLVLHYLSTMVWEAKQANGGILEQLFIRMA